MSFNSRKNIFCEKYADFLVWLKNRHPLNSNRLKYDHLSLWQAGGDEAVTGTLYYKEYERRLTP